jgi:hypothetical protein
MPVDLRRAGLRCKPLDHVGRGQGAGHVHTFGDHARAWIVEHKAAEVGWRPLSRGRGYRHGRSSAASSTPTAAAPRRCPAARAPSRSWMQPVLRPSRPAPSVDERCDGLSAGLGHHPLSDPLARGRAPGAAIFERGEAHTAQSAHGDLGVVAVQPGEVVGCVVAIFNLRMRRFFLALLGPAPLASRPYSFWRALGREIRRCSWPTPC